MSDRSRYHDCGGRAACRDPLDRARRERDRREAGRHAEALLGAGVGGVDPPPVDLDRDPAERRDGVDEQQRVGVAQRGERRDVVLDAGRRLRVHHRDEARVRVLALRVEQPLRIERVPHSSSTRTTSAPQRRATSHMRSPNTPLTPTITVSPGFDQVDEARLHARGAGAAHREGQRVVGAEDGAQARHRLVHDREELRVHVPEHRTRERGDHLGVRVRRAGTEQQTVGDRHAAEPTVPRVPATAVLASDSEDDETGTSAGGAGAPRARTSSPAVMPRATSAAARATCVTSTSGSCDAVRLGDALHGLRGVPRGAGRVTRAVRVTERAVDGDGRVPRVDFVARGVAGERPRDVVDVVDGELLQGGVELRQIHA